MEKYIERAGGPLPALRHIMETDVRDPLLLQELITGDLAALPERQIPTPNIMPTKIHLKTKTLNTKSILHTSFLRS